MNITKTDTKQVTVQNVRSQIFTIHNNVIPVFQQL